ncbi:MAG: heme-binding protein [Pseudomonadota bacterium]
MKRRLVLTAVVTVVIAFLGYRAYEMQTIETPAYAVVHADGAFELRQYPEIVTAEVAREGSRQQAVRSAFGALARYIFARDREGESIAMTAPVTQERLAAEPSGGSRGNWRVAFIMPADRQFDKLPKPASDDIALDRKQPGEFAAIRFSGWWTDALFARKERALREWLETQDRRAAGNAIYAYYNDPLTPGFWRRNEVLVPIAQREGG